MNRLKEEFHKMTLSLTSLLILWMKIWIKNSLSGKTQIKCVGLSQTWT